MSSDSSEWQRFSARYRDGEWRAKLFEWLVLKEIERFSKPRVLLDIGCGRGFDDDAEIQRNLASSCDEYIGVEPDEDLALAPCITSAHHVTLETSSIPDNSVQVAFAVMVLEHLEEPQPFWDTLQRILKPGGTFYGFTVDTRSLFARFSRLADIMRIKDAYLWLLMGQRETERYKNYPTYYRCNQPDQIKAFASAFSSCEVINFSRNSELRPAVPKILWPMTDMLDAWVIRSGRPGSLLVVRATK